MADFNSNFNDIQKQIAVADLTDEQIQALVTALQTRRSARPELTKEERGFFQCCRERRSYANDKDLDSVVCPHCGSIKAIKYGKSKGRQRYLCKDCNSTFGDTNGTVAFRSKLSVGKWIELIKLTLQGESCRTIAKELSHSGTQSQYAKLPSHIKTKSMCTTLMKIYILKLRTKRGIGIWLTVATWWFLCRTRIRWSMANYEICSKPEEIINLATK